ncbi:MAG: hypothetical protein F6K58_31650 [Symploca sp. SIO2E9]|nr:hypothetical protein [Symploca sp. SIO2E9]
MGTITIRKHLMTENTLKIEISFESLLEAVLSLEISKKRELWELLKAELLIDKEDCPEDIAEIQAARADYEAGDYLTFDQYIAQRANKSK